MTEIAEGGQILMVLFRCYPILLYPTISYYTLKEPKNLFVVCLCLQSKWFIQGHCYYLQYANVTGPNQSGSSWDRPQTLNCVCVVD